MRDLLGENQLDIVKGVRGGQVNSSLESTKPNALKNTGNIYSIHRNGPYGLDGLPQGFWYVGYVILSKSIKKETMLSTHQQIYTISKSSLSPC